MVAHDIVELLKVHAGSKAPLPPPIASGSVEVKLLEILDQNSEKIDEAIKKAVSEKKGFVTLAGWIDHWEPSELLLSEEIDALGVHDTEKGGLHASVFSEPFTEVLQGIIRRWVTKRYLGYVEFFDANDGCNDSWIIRFNVT